MTPRTTIFQGLRRDAEDCAETGPSVKPCAWMVTNHVLELNQLDAIGVGLSAALHRLTRARDTRRGLAGPMRRLEASARRERVGALREKHRQSSLCYYLGNRATAFHTGECGGPDIYTAYLSAVILHFLIV